MKSSPIDLGPVAVDLPSMDGNNAGEPKGSHRVISGRAAAGIKGGAVRWEINWRSLRVCGTTMKKPDK
jgi:hypothetical protein